MSELKAQGALRGSHQPWANGRSFGIGLTLLVVLTLGACASDSSSTSTTDLASSENPLSDYLGFQVGGATPSDGRSEFQALEVEIQTCMTRQGFDYIPTSLDGRVVFAGPPQGSLTDDEYAQSHGYGVTTTPDLAAPISSDPNGVGSELPNMPTGLSDQEQAAWAFALFGDLPDIDPETGGVIDPETGQVSDPDKGFAPAGCQGEAFSKSSTIEAAWLALGPDLADLSNQIAADPRTIQLNRAWSECVSSDGFQFAVQPDAEASVVAAFETIDTADEGALAELQRQEIALATADARCRGETNFDDDLAAVRREYELKFIDDEGGRLADFRVDA